MTLLFFLLFSFVYCDKIITTVFGHMTTSYDVLVNLGTPYTSVALVVDLKEPYHTFNIDRFPSSVLTSSTKLPQKEIVYNHIVTNGTIYCTNFKFPDTNIKIFPFYYVSILNSNISYYDSFSLAYHFEDIKYSIVHSLYNNNYIDKKIFAFEHTKSPKTLLHYGGMPSSGSSKKYKGKCNVVEGNNNTAWGCNLTLIAIGFKYNTSSSYYYYNKDRGYYYSFFQLNQRKVSVPGKYYEFLKNKIFSTWINRKKCYFNSKSRLVCNTVFIKSGEMYLDIYFDKVKFRLTLTDIFDEMGDMSELIMDINEKNDTEWIFGVSFLKLYNLLFDYEDKSITFYSDDHVIIDRNDIRQEERNSLKICFICVIIENGIMILYYAYINIKNDKY